ncbi:MAG: FmdB family zinc ribbon protein [candidate division Zixibacteria bacterium]
MPTYPYRCQKCNHEFEEFQSITEDPIEVCPECSGKVIRLLAGGIGLIFKGSGFYQTDYRKSGYSSDAAKDKPASESSSKSKDSKTKSGSTGKSSDGKPT